MLVSIAVIGQEVNIGAVRMDWTSLNSITSIIHSGGRAFRSTAPGLDFEVGLGVKVKSESAGGAAI